MVISAVNLKHVFGLRVGVNGAVGYQNEHTLVYPCGSNLVLYNIDQRTQKFIAGLDKSQKMTAMAISPNRRYVALAETTNENRPIVIIYDLNLMRKKKVLHCAENVQATEFVSIVFSPDSKYLATQTDGPDWLLGYWAWEKSKFLASLKMSSPAHNFAIHQISFNPQDSTQICVVGNLIFKMFRYSENILKNHGIMKIESQNFICHCWVSDERLVLGTDMGKCILMENGEIKAEYILLNVDNSSPKLLNSAEENKKNSLPDELAYKMSSRLSYETSNQETIRNLQPQTNVSSIVATNKGLAVACGLGKVHWFDKTSNRLEPYKKVREIHIPIDVNSADPPKSQNQIITDMCVSPSGTNLIVATDMHQLFMYSIPQTEISKLASTPYFELLSYSFHYSKILGLDLCRRKPIIATCAVDRSVRIWNYETNQLDLYKEFAEEAYSIALHPSGLYILVGFSDKLRLLNILIDDIRPFKEFSIRGCRECAFSNGGHYFAAVNNTLIQVYSTTSFELVWSLKGHNGKIRNTLWSQDDRKLISCGMDGAVYEWDTFNGTRVGESVLKACSYTGITATQDSKTTFAVGTDKTLKEISDSQVIREIANMDVQLTTVALSNSGRMLFCGTIHGAIRSFKFPLSQNSEHVDFLGHCSQITKMKITCNDDYLVSVSDDCTVMIWKIQDKEGRSIKKDKDIGWAEEILITKSDLEEKNCSISELQTRVEELKMENEYQLRLKDMNYNEKIKELTEKFIEEMESLKTRNHILKTEKDKDEARHEQEVKEMIDNHNKELTDIEEKNIEKLKLETEKFKILEEKFNSTKEHYEALITQLENDKEKALEDLTEYYETKLVEKATIVENLSKELRDQTIEYEETKRLIEEDADREILESKIKYERKLKEEREINAKLKGETGIMKKKFASFQKEIEDLKEVIKKYQTETSKLENVIRNIEKDKIGLKKEIQERDETIQDKEKRIYDLKKKNQELDKFKFVLDYKIKELKKELEPKENEILKFKEQIKEMESELERFSKENTQLRLRIDEMTQKLKTTEKELRLERQRTRDVLAQVRRFKEDLYACSGMIQEPKELKENVVKLYKKHIQLDVTVGPITGGDGTIQSDIQKEFGRQRDHLERTVKSLQFKLARDSEIHRVDYVRIMRENVSLLKEINDLRKALRQCRQHIIDCEAALGLHRKQGESARQLLSTISYSHKPAPILERELEEAGRLIEAQRSLLLQYENTYHKDYVNLHHHHKHEHADENQHNTEETEEFKLPPLEST